jgi:hypothetical protein
VFERANTFNVLRRAATVIGLINKKKTTVALDRKRNTSIKRPPLVGEVSANFRR